MNCHLHPDRNAVRSLYAGPNYERIGYCSECALAMDARMRKEFGAVYNERAYATGLGPQVHYEAQEAGRLQREYEEAMPSNDKRGYL